MQIDNNKIIQAMDKKIAQQRKTMGGVFNADQKRMALRKKMLILGKICCLVTKSEPI